MVGDHDLCLFNDRLVLIRQPLENVIKLVFMVENLAK